MWAKRVRVALRLVSLESHSSHDVYFTNTLQTRVTHPKRTYQVQEDCEKGPKLRGV